MTNSTVTIPTRILVTGMAHEDGTILASELYPVAEACGQTPDQIRSCLRRLVTEGLYTRQGSGRAAVFRATEAGLANLGAYVERTRLAYGQDAAGRGWDRGAGPGPDGGPARRGRAQYGPATGGGAARAGAAGRCRSSPCS